MTKVLVESETDPSRRTPQPCAAVALVVLAVGFIVAGIWVYVVHQAPDVDLVRLQWAADLPGKALAGIRQHSVQFRDAVDWDMRALIPGYWAGLLLACYLGWRVFWASGVRQSGV